MNNTEKIDIWLNYGRAADDSICWKLQNNRRFSIFGLESGHIIELIDTVGRKIFSTITADNEHSITVSGVKNGCVVLYIKDKYRKILKINNISLTECLLH